VKLLPEAQGLLSQKLDAMLKDAKIDGELMSSLGNSLKSDAAKSIAPTAESMATKKYSEELTMAAAQMGLLIVYIKYKVLLRNAQN
jgi:hypothetical protein